MPVEDALRQLLDMAEAAPIREPHVLPLADCDGRVLAQDLISTLDLPPWPNSAMDGYALRLADWTGAPLPVSQRIFAGQAQRITVHGAVGPGRQVEGGDQVLRRGPRRRPRELY